MQYAKTLSLVAVLAMVGCAPSEKPAATTTTENKPAAGGEEATPAAKTETVVLAVEGMS